MREFDQQLLRLKQVLGTTEDQVVAEALGMSKAALAQRKARNTFPADKVARLAQDRPELKIDLTYVLKGRDVAAVAAAAASSVLRGYRREQFGDVSIEVSLTAEETDLVLSLRECTDADRTAISHLVQRLADAGQPLPETAAPVRQPTKDR